MRAHTKRVRTHIERRERGSASARAHKTEDDYRDTKRGGGGKLGEFTPRHAPDELMFQKTPFRVGIKNLR